MCNPKKRPAFRIAGTNLWFLHEYLFCALQLQDSKEQMDKRSEVTEEKVEALSTDDNAKAAEH